MMSYQKTKSVDGGAMQELLKPTVRCNICAKTTQTETAVNRGGMCQGCYDDYLGGARQNRIGLGSGWAPS